MPAANHIAFVSPRYSEVATVGGAETLIKSLAERTAAAGRHVTILTTCAESHVTWKNTLPPGRRKVGGYEVEYFPVDEGRDLAAFRRAQTTISNNGVFDERDERLWIDNNVNSQALYEHLREHGNDYDRIIVGPYLFGLSFHASLVHPEKTLLVPCLHDEPFAYLGVMKELFGAVTGFMFNSEPEQALAQRIFGVPNEKCAVVGMGMTPFDADAGAFASRTGLTSPYVVYSGRRELMKGTPLLLDYMDAFRQRTEKDIKVVLTGSGTIEPSPQLAPHVVDLGFVSEQEKHEAMAGAMAFIHPSVNESFGIVLLESWLARTPGLVHEKSEVLKWQCERSRAGLWFRTYPEFEEELLLLLNNEDLRKAMGEAGREYVLREYSWESVEKRLFDALDG
ncbi:MAG: glycosyltransferase family 4 protein [Verrucomicrobia bacterium]|nr:glycosyltransferase family 4 protein [Verrucomicrobiota bacterium]